ncbi:MAG: PAS domain S-box protein [candidate division KSB1 bacterium]|nr:PAS domain S-box protein [candidate division KSB1 bacterium]
MSTNQTPDSETEQSQDARREEAGMSDFLRISESHYRRLFESAKDGILILDAETGMITDANPYLLELLGYSREDLVQKKVWEIGFLADVVANEANFSELQQKEFIRYDDLALEGRDGKRHEVEFISTTYLERGQKVMQCNIREISERKKAERVERESALMIQRIINAIPARVFWKDKDLVILGCNAAFAHDAGFADPADIIGKDDFQMGWREQAEKYRADDRAVIESGCAKLLVEETQTTPAGDTITLLTNKLPLLNEDGEIVGVIGTYMDITALKQSQESRDLLAIAVEQAAEAIIITDQTGSIVYVNPVFETITGYTREDAIGRNPRILKSGKHDEEFYRRMWAELTAGRVFRCRMINKRKDGTLYKEESTISPVQNTTGNITHYVAVKRDLSHETHLEEQLHQAQKMESVGRLAGGVAHDFNNLLMGIMGYAEMCKEEIEPNHAIRGWLDEISLCSERSAEITRQLLAFARKQAIEPKVVNLNDSVESMLKLLRRLIGEDINLAWRPGKGTGSVLIDPAQIDQILANLCVNARDAISGVGEIVIETEKAHIDAEFCASHPDAIPGEYVCLSVSDNGCGMKEEDLAQVFEPFFTTKGVGKGTGLGLSTVYGIAKQNFGSVDVYSEPGKGSTFRVYLQEVEAEVVKTTVTSKAEAPRGRGETILLVEDEKSLRVTCGLFLETLGYHVVVAETPAEALKLTAQHPGAIHLLLTDVVMPGMDGRQLAKRITVAKPGVEVLFMSGYTSDVISRRGVIDEGMHFMSKPFTRDDLARKVRELLDASSVQTT